MKLIKKIAAIMFAFMMVVSMSCNVKADEGTTATGTITINNAIPEQIYTIYKILDLESYSPKEENGKETGNFAYKPSSEWESFINGKNVKDKYFTFEGEYVSWKENADPAEFAKLALDYAKTNSKANQGSVTASGTPVQFTGLGLGYYLVDSSVGTLCSLDTTKPAATIQEKNGVPSVDKIITSGGVVSADGKSNSASIGDTVYFQTTITAQPGAQNYVLHDKMTKGLTLDSTSIKVQKDNTNLEETNYKLITSDFKDGCTFEIEFTQKFCDKLKANDTITVTYSAVLNENAEIGNVDTNTNEAWLKYGDSQTTQHKTTTTKTFEMNVFKFYKDKKNSDKETGLADAKFTLSKNQNGTDPIKLIDKGSNTYRVAKTGTVTEITTPNDGKFKIQGLGAGTYYLTETQQPAGYNKLSGPVTVVIDETGLVKVGESEANPVKVENKTGTVLPSTGGAGTTMIYLIGGALVLGSGVVLVTKRRVKGK